MTIKIMDNLGYKIKRYKLQKDYDLADIYVKYAFLAKKSNDSAIGFLYAIDDLINNSRLPAISKKEMTDERDM